MHARFLFFMLSIVSCVVRAQLVKPAGRIFYVHDLEPLPGRMPGRLSIVHDPGRPTSAVVLVLCGVVRCCAAVHARAPAGLYGLLRRLWPYHGRRKSTGMPAPARGRQRPRTSPRARAPAGRTGRRRDACTTSTRYPWKSSRYASWSTSWSVVMRSSPWTSSTSRGLPAQA